MTPRTTPAESPAGSLPGEAPALHRSRRSEAAGPARIVINPEWCKGCHICVSVCPRDVLAIDQAAWAGGFHPVVVAQPERCTVCRHCELLCPDLAIEVLAEG